MFGGKRFSELSSQDLDNFQHEVAAMVAQESLASRSTHSCEGTNMGIQGSTSLSDALLPNDNTSGSLPPGFGPGGFGGPEGGISAHVKVPKPGTGLTREEVYKKLIEENEKEKGPMDAAEYRAREVRQAQQEAESAPADMLPNYEDIAKQYSKTPEGGPTKARSEDERPLTEEHLRHQALNESERSQMPAVQAKDGETTLLKTIEHYMFADSEETASFYVTFNKDLWEGASKFVTDSQVTVNSTATTLDIRLQGVPVSEKCIDSLAEWRLTLAPLFSRVEPMLTTHKIRNGKLSVKLAKSKSGSWKKGVKYS